jgi:hypothetical protein
MFQLTDDQALMEHHVLRPAAERPFFRRLERADVPNGT